MSWDYVFDEIEKDALDNELSPGDTLAAWKIGLAEFCRTVRCQPVRLKTRRKPLLPCLVTPDPGVQEAAARPPGENGRPSE